MSKYPANPKKLQNFTQSGEDQVFVGKRNVTDFLPSILQTNTNKRFLSTTLDQLLSSGSTETLDTYWGRIKGKDYKPARDLFVPETSARRLNNQLAPSISLKDGLETTDTVTYNSMLDMLRKVGTDVEDIDTLTRDQGYVLDLPLDVDMFVNHKNYYWLDDDIPPCVIEPTTTDPIDIDNIYRLSNYTTPVLTNGKTLEFHNGMRVVFVGSNVTSASGNYRKDVTYWVEGVGSGNIKFVEHIDENNKIKFYHVQPYTQRIPSDWDGESWDSHLWDYSDYKSPLKEYIVANRSSVDQNAWARANQWYSMYAINATCDYNELDSTDFLTTANRGQRPIICWESNLELINAGQNFIKNVDHVIENVDVDADIIGQQTYVNEQLGLEEFDTVLFINCGVYSSGIYQVNGVNNSIILTQLHAPNSYNDLDKVLVLHGPDLPGVNAGYPGLELYWDGSAWVQGQQKDYRGDYPLFQLYSDSGTRLQDFPDSDFTGDPIFYYAPNTAGVTDNELGFAPKYNTQNNNNDIEFELTLNTKKYYTDLGTTAARAIFGYYYAKDIVNSKYTNGWSKIRGGQRTPVIKTHIASAEETVKFDLDTDSTTYSNQYVFQHTATGFNITLLDDKDIDTWGETNPKLNWFSDKQYTVVNAVPDSNKRFVFTDPYGQISSDINTVSGTNNEYTVTVSSSYPYSTVYYMTMDEYLNYNNVAHYNSGIAINTPEFAGRIFITNNNQRRIKVYRNGDLLVENDDYTINANNVTLNEVAKANDIYEIEYVTDNKSDSDAYDISPITKYNPLNRKLSQVSFSNLLEHFRNQIESAVGFVGNSFGENNLQQISRQIHSGGTIREQNISHVKLGYLMQNSQTNPFNALRQVSTDYQNFKNYFKTKVHQLWKTSDRETTVREIVNNALQEINIGKNSNFSYGNSDMLYYSGFANRTYSITDATVDFDLDYAVNRYSDRINHVYVYLKEFNGSNYVWRQLQKGVDYTEVDVDILTLSQPATLNSAGDPATLQVFQKDISSPSYVPPSTVKLGFFKPTQVEVVNGILHCHDGSTHECTNTEFYDTTSSNFDVVTACMIELETRIVAGLLPDHNTVEEVTSVLPNANFGTSNQLADMKSILDDWYNLYAIENNITGYNASGYYDVADEFTWNYSSVGPGVGGWKSVYTHYFGTVRPDTHPWEMLGHRVKPQWWDTHYSWTDPTKRANLINSLITGEVEDPASTTRTTDIKYRRSSYDWNNNTLVTTSGVLNGPVTAGVVPAPSSVNRSSNFDFNDWGPYEDNWRQTSAYRFALVECAMLFKPFRVFEKFFNIQNIKTIDNINTQHTQYVNRNRRYRSGPEVEILNQNTVDRKCITHIEVTDPGQGYNNSTTITVPDTLLGTSRFKVRVSNGGVQAIAVLYTVPGFRDDVSVTINGVTGSSGADAKAYTDMLPPTLQGFNSVLTEWSKLYSITPDNILDDFKNLEVELALHVGGYTDKNILKVLLDSSYQKGPVELPKQDFSIILNKSAPVKSVFYSGLKVSKSAQGYTVSGFNRNDRTFTIIPPSTGGTSYNEQIGNLDVKRYVNFKNTTQKFSYGYTMLKRQELYDFINGLGEYYTQQGFDVKQRWLQDAKRVMEWSLQSDPEPIYVNGLQDTLIYNQGSVGYVDYIGYNYDGSANIIDRNDKQIKPSQLLVLRNDTTTEFSLKDTSKDIFGLSVNVIEYEHVITMNNISQFNDTTYDPVTGAMHTRVKLEGERTRNWNGRIEAPGYLVKKDGIMANLDTSTREIERDNINSDSKTLNSTTRNTARFNVGYQQASYLTNSFVEDNAAYNFGKGQRIMNGTTTGINAFMRNRNLFGTNTQHNVYEEWMIRLGDYGDTSQRNPIEVQLNSDLLKTNPQAMRFNSNYVNDISSDLIIDYHSGSTSLITGDVSKPFPALDPEFRINTSIADEQRFESFLPNAGLPLEDEAEYKIGSIDDIGSVYSVLEDYANISNWSNLVAYKKGDLVRKDGKVYQLAIDTTGLATTSDTITVRGSEVYPSVLSGATVIIDNTTVTFNKTATTTTFNAIDVLGSIVNPTAPNNSTLIIDGTTVVLEKTQTTTTYSPIVVNGTVGNPTVTGNAGEGLLIDGVFVDLDQDTTVTTNISALSALIQAFSPAFVTNADENTLAVARVNALEDLRVAYSAINGSSAWITWIGDYYTGSFANSGLNFVYLNAELGTANPGYTSELTALLQNDIDLVNAVTNQSYTIANQPTNTDINTSVSALDAGAYMTSFSNYAKTGTSILTSSTVDTISSTAPRLWDIDDLVQQINSVLTANGNTITSASKNSSNQLAITKNAVAGNTILVIGSAGSNIEVGFPTNSTSYNSTTSTVVSGVNLSLIDIIQTINNSGITGVSATDNNGLLQITSVNQSLTLGNGTANTNVGIGAGTYNATSNVTTSPTDLQIYDLVDQINAANIPGITAINVNNNLIIESSNPDVVIGAGTANVDIGLNAGTYSAEEAINNTFDLTDWNKVEDPANFRVWTLDNIGVTTINTNRKTGYNVLQVFDFEMEISEICAGNRIGDDALVKTASNSGVSIGDFIMIVNSTCTPSVDGIHQVIDVEDSMHFYIDKYIQEIGTGGKMLVLRPTRFNDTNEMQNTLNDTKYLDNGLGWRPGMYAYVDSVIEGGIGSRKGAVYQVVQTVNGLEFEKVRDQALRADNTKIKNAILFNTHTDERIETFEVFHPLAGIIPGAVEKELSFKSQTDIAVYTNTTDENYSVDDNSYWDEQHVGDTWWDLKNAIYFDYEQGDLVYKQGMWGKLFPTGSIDVYEWTKSTVTPDEYADAVNARVVVDGVQLTGTPYSKDGVYGETMYYWSEITEYNSKTDTEETYYYFWVKDKTTKIGENRSYTTTQLANILTDPKDYGFNWVAASGTNQSANEQNSILVSNLETFINNGESALQLNFADTEVELHREYILLAENDPSTVIPEWLHMGLRDSIASFDKNTITETYVDWSSSATYALGTMVKSPNGDFYRAINVNSGQNPDTNLSDWARIYDAIDTPDGSYSDTNTGRVEYLAPNPVPDTNLHPLARYGNQIRPRQSWIKNLQESRRVLIDKLNRQLLKINLVDTVPNWDRVLGTSTVVGQHTYNYRDFWEFVDWQAETYIPEITPDRTVRKLTDLNLAPAIEGEIALVTSSNDKDGVDRNQVYQYTGGVWEIQFKENATIQFKDGLWDYNIFGFGWDNTSWDFYSWDIDPGAILGDILDTVRNDIFVGQFVPQYTDMWFTMLNYINSEQNNLDWAFKSTYIKTVIQHSLMKDTKLFQLDRIDDVIDFINTTKPFHTKLRDLLTVRDITDPLNLQVEEQDTRMNVTMRVDRHTNTGFTELTIKGGDNWAEGTHTDISSFTTYEGASGTDISSTTITTDDTSTFIDGSNSDFTHMYNCLGFRQPEYAGHATEVYPVQFDEAVEMRVTTNTNGATEDADTLKFRMFINSNRETEAVVINNSTTLDGNVASTDTQITVADSTQLYQGTGRELGVVWINNERITFTHVYNETLMNCTRGTGGTSPSDHSSGATVYDGGPSTKIPTLKYIQQYGQELRPAFNDFGKSITDATSTSSETVFIQQNG